MLTEQVIRDKADFFTAQKRNINRETPMAVSTPSSDSIAGPIAHLAAGTTPSVNAYKREQLGQIEQAIHSLNDDQREPFVMHYHAGMSFDEISQELGCSSSAIRMRIGRATVRIAEILRVTDTSNG